MRVVVVSWTAVAARARSTAGSAATLGLLVTVLDLDGSYGLSADVRRPADLGLDEAALRRQAAAFGAASVATALVPALVRALGQPDEPLLIANAGVVLLARPEVLVRATARSGLAMVERDPGPVPPDGRHPDEDDLARSGPLEPALVAAHPALAGQALERWELRHAPPAGPWVEPVRDPTQVVSAWTIGAGHRLTAEPDLHLDGRPVAAVDLSRIDTRSPWLLDPSLADPRFRLSDQPALARLVATEVQRWTAAPTTPGAWDPDRAGTGHLMDDTLRRAAAMAGSDGPDLLDPVQAQAARTWLVSAPAAGGLPPYLAALRDRADLAAAFPAGTPDTAFLTWVEHHAVADGAPADLISPSVTAAAARRPVRSTAAPEPGVNVVGFLGAELGIGESARLLTSALAARGVAHATVPVDRFSQSRASKAAVRATTAPIYDTTIVCVNSDLTPTVAPAVAELLSCSYRIGMWYWEVEDFPPTQHAGFAFLDEVWVATEFVRSAIAPHSPVPVVTLTPPLPQRAARPPALDRAAIGLEDRPYLLFSFDFLSTAQRKNPTGLVEAFSRAFSPDEGPLLVIKSINADKRPAEAEHLRLAAAGRPDVFLIEAHLDPEQRDALTARCAAYVSLHRAEGLGLTMAEAMAWGRPVVATGYSGNLAFMTEENSFLVAWRPAVVPEGAPPYPAGGIWAEPDLDDAARLIRLMWDEPELASARGMRAAHDIATAHNPEVAGRAIEARLAELAGARRRAVRRGRRNRLRAAVYRPVRSVGRRLLG